MILRILAKVMAELRSQVFDDRVYVFTPKGEVVDLPAGSTPLDFAYAIHSEIGHRCIGAKVGGRIVPFTYHLQMGEQVDIITQKNPNPSRDWVNPNLGFTHTSKSASQNPRRGLRNKIVIKTFQRVKSS